MTAMPIYGIEPIGTFHHFGDNISGNMRRYYPDAMPQIRVLVRKAGQSSKISKTCVCVVAAVVFLVLGAMLLRLSASQRLIVGVSCIVVGGIAMGAACRSFIKCNAEQELPSAPLDSAV